MIKHMHKKIWLFIIVITAVASCSKKPAVEYTPTYKMAGEWFTRYYQGGSAITTFHKILTYNTSDPGINQVWVDDPNVWTFKSKFDVDYNTLSFKSMESANDILHTGNTVKVYEGKVLPNAGVSKSGNKVDSIYLKVEFSDDPGTIYEIRGHQRTGFFEDEY